MATEYAKTRLQFGRPIGSYQAIKHKCAEMLVAVEIAKSAAYARALRRRRTSRTSSKRRRSRRPTAPRPTSTRPPTTSRSTAAWASPGRPRPTSTSSARRRASSCSATRRTTARSSRSTSGSERSGRAYDRARSLGLLSSDGTTPDAPRVRRERADRHAHPEEEEQCLKIRPGLSIGAFVRSRSNGSPLPDARIRDSITYQSTATAGAVDGLDERADRLRAYRSPRSPLGWRCGSRRRSSDTLGAHERAGATTQFAITDAPNGDPRIARRGSRGRCWCRACYYSSSVLRSLSITRRAAGEGPCAALLRDRGSSYVRARLRVPRRARAA